MESIQCVDIEVIFVVTGGGLATSARHGDDISKSSSHDLCKARINVPDLFTEKPTGDYHYSGGFNPRALIALVPAAIISIVIALVPYFDEFSEFSWFIGAALGAIFYLVVADRSVPIRDVSGEPIAVPSVH